MSSWVPVSGSSVSPSGINIMRKQGAGNVVVLWFPSRLCPHLFSVLLLSFFLKWIFHSLWREKATPIHVALCDPLLNHELTVINHIVFSWRAESHTQASLLPDMLDKEINETEAVWQTEAGEKISKCNMSVWFVSHPGHRTLRSLERKAKSPVTFLSRLLRWFQNATDF